MQILTVKTTEGGFPSYTRFMSDYIDSVAVVANTNTNYNLAAAIAAGAKFMIISANGDFYARFGGTAVIPTTTTTDGSASELNPSAFDIETANMPSGATTIGFIAPAATKITLAFYK